MIEISIKNVNMCFETVPSLFSPSSVDLGTLAMLSAVEIKPDDKVMDMGCGYGVVGIYAARLGAERVIMSDIDCVAVEYARRNADRSRVNADVIQSDGFNSIDETDFSLILINPPYHADFGVAKRFIEKGFNRLRLGGRLVMVTKRLDWYKNKLTAIFGGVRVIESGGYYVFIAERRSYRYANAKTK